MAFNYRELAERQRFLQKQIRNEQKIDRKIELLSIINQLTSGPKNLVQKEHVLIEAEARGFSEHEVNELMELLILDNIIFESMPGYIKKR